MIDFGDESLGPSQRAVRSAGFNLLLETGQPVGLEVVASRSGVSLPIADDVVRHLALQGSAHLDSDDRLVGVAGLGVNPTRHRMTLAAGDRWAWCALDAIGIVGAVGRGTIISRGPLGTFDLSFQDDGFDPDDLAIFLADGYSTTDSRDQWCRWVHFFGDVASADLWAHEQRLSGRGVPMTDIVTIAVDRWKAIMSPSNGGSRRGFSQPGDR